MSAPSRVLDLPAIEPFPWSVLLNYLAARLVPEREQVRGDTYVRDLGSRAGKVEVGYDAARSALVIDRCAALGPAGASARVARLFNPTQDVEPLLRLAADPIIGPRIAACPGLRPLGCWDPFELCVRTLIGQQVSVKAAQSLTARLVERCGAIEPAPLVRANLDRIGMPGRRVAAIQRFAAAAANGDLELDAPWAELDDALARLSGFGPWTRAYLGIRLGRDPDAFPAADAGLLRATGLTSPRALAALAERWRPWRAYAATYLWMVAPVAPDA